jgi:hypothetical protein
MQEIYKIYYTLIKELHLQPSEVDVMPFWYAEQLYNELCKSKE